jgi:hypothetical protein
MPGPFIPTQDDVRRAQAIVGAYARTRLETIAARPGNPTGGEFRSFDVGAVALRMPGFPGSAFNNAYGFSDEHIEAIPGLIDWYKAGAGGAFALAPGAATVKTAGLLADAGFRLSVWHATMIGPPELPSADAPGVTIEPVTDEAALGPFADVYHRGWNYTAFRIPMQSWLTAPGWRLYLARFEGEPAGAAIWTARTAIWPTGRSTRTSATTACTGRCSTGAWTTRAPRARSASCPAATTSRAASATSCAKGSRCCSPRPSGRCRRQPVDLPDPRRSRRRASPSRARL